MDQLTLWKTEPVTAQLQLPNTNKQELLREMARLLLEIVVKQPRENKSGTDDE